jgi:hypothetical protein
VLPSSYAVGRVHHGTRTAFGGTWRSGRATTTPRTGCSTWPCSTELWCRRRPCRSPPRGNRPAAPPQRRCGDPKGSATGTPSPDCSAEHPRSVPYPHARTADRGRRRRDPSPAMTTVDRNRFCADQEGKHEMTSPFTLAVVRCRHPLGPARPNSWSPTTASTSPVGSGRSAGPSTGSTAGSARSTASPGRCVARRRKVASPIGPARSSRPSRDGHDFGMAIMRRPGCPSRRCTRLCDASVRRGWTVCELESAEVAVRRQRPQRKIYRLTEVSWTSWAGPADRAGINGLSRRRGP